MCTNFQLKLFFLNAGNLSVIYLLNRTFIWPRELHLALKTFCWLTERSVGQVIPLANEPGSLLKDNWRVGHNSANVGMSHGFLRELSKCPWGFG